MSGASRPGIVVSGVAVALVVAGLGPRPALGWTTPEHRVLADSALSAALGDLGAPDRLLVRSAVAAVPPGPARGGPEPPGFGSACAWAARDDRAQARYHLRGRTTLEELASFRAPGPDSPAGVTARNVVAAYLGHHLRALALAHLAGAQPAAGGGQDLLVEAFSREALAQGYLADAFAAGHLMPPAQIRLAGLLPLHRRHAHDYYASQGAYVINARGDAWQTFGDRLLLWYGPTYAHVLEACVTSLREVLLTWTMARGEVPAPLATWADSVARPRYPTRARMVAAWLARHDGPRVLEQVALPSLTLVPMPVVAAWSVRTQERDAHGLRRRRFYPQLSDAGGHDPTLDARDVAQLPSRGAVPSWMVPESLFTLDPGVLVREDRTFASVRYAQPRALPPRDAGPVLALGEVRDEAASGGSTSRTLSLGYVVAGEPPALLHQLSLEGVLMEPAHGGRPGIAAFMVAGNLKPPGIGIWRRPPLRWLENVRFGAGHAWTRGGAPFEDGARYVLGLESPALPIGASGASMTLRLERQWMQLARARRGLGFEVVLQ